MVQTYAEAGYRVTVVCTLFNTPAGIELRPEVLKWTHDVHILPSFLRAKDFPRYLKHLITSRGIQQVVLSNSQLIYEMLPALVEQLPDVQFIDVRFVFFSSSSSIFVVANPSRAQYLHNEAYDGWKSGGYPSYSLISQRYLARTLVCSSYLRQYLINAGHSNPSRIGIVKLGIDLSSSSSHPITPTSRQLAKQTMLGLEKDSETIVITVVGRLDPQKRPLLIPFIVNELMSKIEQDFIIVMIGDGDLRYKLERQVRLQKVEDYVQVMGTRNDTNDFLRATDIFLLPSVSEGLSIAVAEAMALGIPILTSRAGALPEQLGEDDSSSSSSRGRGLGGILVNHTLIDELDAPLYAEELKRLVEDPHLRNTLGMRGRELVTKGFDWRKTLKGMFEEVGKARNLVDGVEERSGGKGREGEKKLPHPSGEFPFTRARERDEC